MRTRPELAGLQETFVHAVLRAGLLVPETVASMAGPSRERRIGVYRNNVKASLVAALVGAFPVVQRLVGEEFFEAAAFVFVEHHPPRSPVLAEYGAGFAAFLEGFEPARDLPYLADIARLEWARQQAFHCCRCDADRHRQACRTRCRHSRFDSAHPASGGLRGCLTVAHRVDLDDQLV